MRHHPARYLRPLLVALLAIGFTACHFHGCGHGGHRSWRAPIPMRHCR